MALFQKSILNSVKQDESLIASRWSNFQNYLAKVDAIRDFKEEIYQDGFFKDIFESCLGYTLNTTNPHGYTLERENKNETDGKKADGVIVINGEIIGVVELKDQKTKNLDAVETQAFNYHASHSRSQYIIISNFDELRFYIDKKTAYEKFNLFTLTYAEFKTLHLLLSFESIKEGIPLTLKEKSATFEATISKQLYKDFSAFRTHLFENIVKNNYKCHLESSRHPELDSGSKIADQARNDEGGDSPVIPCHDTESITKQTLLRLTQKLCDRIIFILFAEDRGLLHPNTIKEIRTRHAQDVFGHPIYAYYKIYFNAINTGHEKLGIPKYNGGLFAPDALLDSLIIEDAYLDMEAQKLSDYDFESDISVNILGHIFEQSLTDLEEMEKTFTQPSHHPEPSRHPELDSGSTKKELDSRLRGNDKSVSKRKKDGIFYTPEYITRYIVENTLGKLCADKRDELAIGNETLVPHNLKKLTKEEIKAKENLLAYREWLTHLKILDPACGSGAFLNQALEFLIREHTLIRDLLLPFQDLMIGYEIEKSILEHNLYGVDINEDAVEIAKLSLWLRTAHKGRELINLGAKIKCGNSLISDRSVAENAFVWEEEFPEVFNPRHPELDSGSKIADQVRNDEKRGFDVVIGNPPYVALNKIKDVDYSRAGFEVFEKTGDLLALFIEKGLRLTADIKYFSFIVSNSWLKTKYGEPLKRFLEKNGQTEVLNFVGTQLFEDATVESCIVNSRRYASVATHSLVIPAQAGIQLDSRLRGSDESITITNIRNFTTQNASIETLTQAIENSAGDDGESLLMRKIESIGKPLKEWDVTINYGIKTGFNEAFIIDTAKRDELVASDPKSAEIIKPILRGRDVQKYETNWANIWLINPHNNPPIDINNYLVVKEHLDSYYEKLEKRTDKGKTPYNLRNCAYLEDFEKPKIIWGEMSDEPKFTFDDKSYFINNTIFMMTGESLKYLLAFLNSKLSKWYFERISTTTGVGTTRWLIYKVELLPIAIADNETPFINFVDEILETKPKIKEYKTLLTEAIKNDQFDREIKLKKAIETMENRVIECEKEIDAMVYKLYGLSADEIGIVEGIG